MSIERCIENEFRPKKMGVAGCLSNGSFRTYQCHQRVIYCCLPDEAIGEILRSDVTDDTEKRLRSAVLEHARRFKQQSLWMNTISFATPALEVLSPEQLFELGLELLSLNVLIAEHCVKHGIRRPALIGTQWDMAPSGPLRATLARYGIEAQSLTNAEMSHSLTACVFNEANGYISYGGLLKETNDFCVDVANRLLYESAGTLDAFIICNPELRHFIPWLRQRLRGSNAAIPIINATELHLAALSARSFRNPLS